MFQVKENREKRMKEKEKRLKHLQDKKEANFKAKQLVDKVQDRLAAQNFSTVLE